tara:strand:+ start:31 stop:252 length:222 start_codon:yes stop_codon:yes gene_type:complete
MKHTLTILILLIFTSVNATAKDKCKDLKKASKEYVACKSKKSGSWLKNKLNNLKITEGIKKFKNAKTLADLKE